MELKVCPSTLAPGHTSFSPEASLSLFGEAGVSPFLDLDFERDLDRALVADTVGRLSVSGVQEKMGGIVENGRIRLTTMFESGTLILKPAPLDYTLTARKQVPANEHLTMQIASQVYGIETAANGLCFDRKGRPVYVTRRYDIRPDGTKLQMEDMASVCGSSEQLGGRMFKYEGCYEDIALALKRWARHPQGALERLLRLVAFNYVYGNGDAHLKNFSLIEDGGGGWRLAPAYDLLNTSLHLQGDDLALRGGLTKDNQRSDAWERTGHPCRTDFEHFGEAAGLGRQRVKRVLDCFGELPEAVETLAGRSFLDAKMRRRYLALVGERMARFNRQ